MPKATQLLNRETKIQPPGKGFPQAQRVKNLPAMQEA